MLRGERERETGRRREDTPRQPRAPWERGRKKESHMRERERKSIVWLREGVRMREILSPRIYTPSVTSGRDGLPRLGHFNRGRPL
jgi:hypothetical protein